jgi:Uma2 family endonuclease
MSEAATLLPHRAPYTVDDLFEMPDDGCRYEVFGGALVVTPAPAPIHQFVTDELREILKRAVRPHRARAITNVAVRISERDGPCPDIVVTTASLRGLTGAVPHDEVHTVVEVVSPSTTLIDRNAKPALYADAGIPCYWRVEPKPHRGYSGPLPLIVARLRDGDGWRTIEAAAGKIAELPMAVGRDHEDVITVKLDPAALLEDL